MAEKKDSTKSGLVGAATAVLAGKGVAPRVLGYHTVSHGTSHEVARKIKKEGFDPKKGGSGAGTHAAGTAERATMFKTQSANKVHVTKDPLTARMFAGATETKRTPRVKDLAKGKVLKARVTDQHFKTMKKDPHMGNGPKWSAATTHHKIPAHQVVGGAGDKGIRGVVNKNTLRKYYASASGKGRAARGVALAGLAAHGAHKAYSAVKSKLEKKASLTELARAQLED